MAEKVNERQAITNLQTYLRQLSYHDSELTKVPVDGIYGDDTRKAVTEFQGKHCLSQTGIVDRETWELIFEQYSASIEEYSPPEKINPFPRVPGNYALSPGDSWFLVDIVQFMLIELTESYDGFDGLQRTGVYDKATERAVRDFQKRNRIPETGKVDKRTWNSIVRQYNIRVKDYMQ